ncbi:NAD(P)-dependent alcohol dehydrogenase [Pontimonas sp.]|uniref:NAD(P)-dependent alcohol dehydrogenase n=1 Tax=Pontimonas sp. TaxID=2304492 RepID=UPI0028700058|nr:NAD(P)-dependent alcohol dehydrogenase [Pontimonas sp.]MDR9396977.1 NAD(P)-dependent alcohol dehydrogenase [Pontimonas sp.]
MALMRALVVEKKGELALRDIDVTEELGANDVRIALKTVGICASDVHYYTDGAIGDFVVREPLILGHEASGEIIEVGSGVTHLSVGDRVCMEPGVPNPESIETKTGHYNLDPDVRFWATPPVHGVLRKTVVHPAAFTFPLPDNVSFAEGAMVEPLAVGLHAANKARITPGDVAVVHGAGTIGMVTALAALAGGCSRVFITDIVPEKLALAETLGEITAINVVDQNVAEVVSAETAGRGADIVFECSGNQRVAASVFDATAPGGTVVFVGLPPGSIDYDILQGSVKEITVQHVFRYANVYDRAIALMASGKIDVTPLLTDRYPFEQSVEAVEAFLTMRPESVKIQIDMD